MQWGSGTHARIVGSFFLLCFHFSKDMTKVWRLDRRLDVIQSFRQVLRVRLYSLDGDAHISMVCS
jgi:hypothetical protein